MPTTLESQPITEGGQTTSEQRAADQGQNNETAPEKLSPSLDRIEAAIRDLIAQERTAQGQGPKYEEIRDLEAQEGMAFWAKTMFWATIAAVFLTFAGIILIWRTLIHTRHAAEAARDMVTEGEKTTIAAIEATNAAVDANSIAREMSERQLRAYIFINGSKRTRRGINDPWTIETQIKNFGQTPAYSINLLIDQTIVDAAGSANVELPEPKETSKFDLAPGHAFTLRQDMPELDGEIWRALKARQKVIFVWGRMDFTDAFDKKRWVTFRLFQSGGYIQNLLYDDKGNETSESAT